MKLISMIDFVLSDKVKSTLEYSTAYKLIQNYANFLKQPLKLEMFVPCDNNGNVLENPLASDEDAGSEKEFKQIQYNNSKEKVLFVFKPHFDISAIKHHILQDRNIEYLANFGELELTEKAIKQIGL